MGFSELHFEIILSNKGKFLKFKSTRFTLTKNLFKCYDQLDIKNEYNKIVENQLIKYSLQTTVWFQSNQSIIKYSKVIKVTEDSKHNETYEMINKNAFKKIYIKKNKNTNSISDT